MRSSLSVFYHTMDLKKGGVLTGRKDTGRFFLRQILLDVFQSATLPIAVYNGTNGGTRNTIEYANLCKRVVVVLN